MTEEEGKQPEQHHESEQPAPPAHVHHGSEHHEHKEHLEQHVHREKPQTLFGLPLLAAVACIALVSLAIGYFAYGFANPQGASSSAGGLDELKLKNDVGVYLNGLLALRGTPGVTADATGVSKNESFYSVDYDIKQNGETVQSGQVFVSLDGKSLFLAPPVDLTQGAPKIPTPTPIAYKKTDKPLVQMFVMSFCPYGIQAESGVGPATGLLSGAITFEPHFIVTDINTSLHGPQEAQEDARQLCVLKYDRANWWKYVDYVNNNCGLNNIDSCWLQAANATGVNATRIQQCFNEEGDALIGAEAELTQELGVQGSPTIFINGVTYEGDRSPESFKAAFCSSFNNPPAACSQTLPSTASAASGSCGV